MNTSAAVRKEIEGALYRRVPGALSPQIRAERVRFLTGIRGVDVVARGGFPVGAITEVVGAESSGRTTLAASFTARRTAEGQVLAWVDVTDALDPESMAAAGVDLERMLWVRCGERRGGGQSETARVVSRGEGSGRGGAAMLDRTISAPSLGGGCGSPHPRSEGRGLSEAIGGLMGGLAAELMVGPESRGSTKSQPGGNKALLPAKRKDKWIGTPSAANRTGKESEFSWRSEHREEQVPTDRQPVRRGGVAMSGKTGGWEPRCTAEGNESRRAVPHQQAQGADGRRSGERGRSSRAPEGHMGGGTGAKAGHWIAIDQALRAVDMLLQAGGFGVVVLDLGGVAAEAVWRIPMATWFRFRAAAERSQACLVLLTQYACARSSAELVLDMEPGAMLSEGRVMTGVAYGARVGRQRFVAVEAAKVVAIRGEETRDGDAMDVEFGRRRPPQAERSGAWSGQAAWAQAGGVADMRATAGKAGLRGRTGRSR